MDLTSMRIAVIIRLILWIHWGLEKDRFEYDFKRDSKKIQVPMLDVFMSSATTNDPITVVEEDDNITIYAYVNISGSGADEFFPNSESMTYRQATIDGIKSNWSGEYNGKSVNVIILDLGDGKNYYTKDGQKSLSITINSGTGVPHIPSGAWKSWGDPGELILYQGDSRESSSARYSTQNFAWVASHEFGHALGIGDAYGNEDTNYNSIMNGFGMKVHYADISMMLKSYKAQDVWQQWPTTWPEDWSDKAIN